MLEFVLVVWLYLPGQAIAPGIEVGVYYDRPHCEAVRDTVKTERDEVSFISMCVERLR